MIRKVYWDFIKQKISQGKIGWITNRIFQYFLIYFSPLFGKPLCGPILGTLLVTYKCNYRCKMCQLPQQGDRLKTQGASELSTAEFKAALDDFAALGTSGIGFTGGEPLLRQDIFELISYAKKKGMVTHLNTNGFFLDRENSLKVVEAGTDSVNISLDGAVPATHDAIRGHPGGFERVISAVKNLKQARDGSGSLLRIKVVCVLDETNIGEIPALFKLAEDIGADCVEVIPQQPFFNSGADLKKRFDGAFMQKLDTAIQYLQKFRSKSLRLENSQRHLKLFKKSFLGEKSPLRCYAGYNSYGVDCYGQIYPCVPWINWNKPVANVKDIPLKVFWPSPQYNKIRQSIWRCRDCYLNCQSELNLLFNWKNEY